MSNVLRRFRLSLPFLALLSVAACGGPGGARLPASPDLEPTPTPGDPNPPFDDAISATFLAGETVHAVEAEIALSGAQDVQEVEFQVHTRPGGNSEDVRVALRRTYLDRTGGIDAAQGRVRFPVFGLYADHANDVTLRVRWTHGAQAARSFTVVTDPAPPLGFAPRVQVEAVAPTLDASFLILQASARPRRAPCRSRPCDWQCLHR